MQPETYTLMHRMHGAASTKRELEIVLKRFSEIFQCTYNSPNREARFDAAWARSCMASLYTRLHEPYLAEETYKEAIALFEREGHELNAATMSVALAEFYCQMRMLDEAEVMLKHNIVYLIRHWGPGHRHVMAAEEELIHFQRTGEMIEAYRHRWCKACNVDEYGVGFDFDDTDRAQR